MIVFSRLNLFQQGLLILLLPVTATVLLIAYMTFLEDVAGKEAAQQFRYARIVLAANQYCNALSRAAMPTFSLLGPPNDQLIQDVVSADRSVKNSVKRLKQLLSPSPEDQADLHRVEDEARRLKKLQLYYAGAAADLQAFATMRTHPPVDPPDFEEFSTVYPIIARYQALQDATEQMGDRKLHVRSEILVAVGGSLILSISLLALMMRSFIIRLNHLKNNAKALACAELFEPALEGSDELAVLDRTFYTTAVQLKEMKKRRAELFELVSGYLFKHVEELRRQIAQLNECCAGLNERGISIIQKSQISVERMVNLIQELSGQQEEQKAHFEAVRVAQIVDMASHAVSRLAEEKKVTIEQPNISLSILADKNKLVQVLINLLSNAVKFSPTDSVVSLSAEQRGNQIIISVTDQGRGIPQEFLSKMFTPFTQAETADPARAKGTGLGLAICKSIVEEHGGTISVKSEVGKGSTFSINLPLDPNASRTRRPPLSEVSGLAPDKSRRFQHRYG